MPREFSRVKRVGDLIQKELANLIHTDLKDPRVGMVTINEANVSRDLAYADIYFTVLPDHENEAVEALLNQAGGFLRFQLARVLKIRRTPKLRFHYDPTTENGSSLGQIIDDAIANDKRRGAGKD